MKLYGYHRSKAMRDIGYLAKPTDDLWAALLFKLNVDLESPRADAFALALTLEKQARFGLGYYHPRQDILNKALQAREERARRAALNTTPSTDDPTLLTQETAA